MSTATTIASREFHLVARPDGEPTPDHFALVEAELDPPDAGDQSGPCLRRGAGSRRVRLDAT